MIKYALSCETCDHGFEAWFASSSAFDSQRDKGLINCPECAGSAVEKQIMAPAVSSAARKGKTPDVEAMAKAFASKARQHVAENFDYVGDQFAHEARSMFYGETDERPIWGETTSEESEALKEEGIPAAPLPKPFTPPPPKSDKDIN